ncbi:MAG: hypothetical protein KC933_13905 [Myxococcales bacterium]|nr:hypothetical protein [Myxococcales bacterium]MCB9649146.1 hypothetical protein [Deltaproteobacteria bacterium]
MRDDEVKDDLLTALGQLPAVDVDDWRREHVRLGAQAELRRAGTRVSWLAAAYVRVVEPISVALISGSYLVWAVQRVLHFHGF